MKRLFKLIPGLLILIGLAACQQTERIDLFNGSDLDNWAVYTDSAGFPAEKLFYAEDGVIKTPGIPFGYLKTNDTYSNYKLHVEWRWTGEPTNSGIFLHTQGKDMIFPLCAEAQLRHESAGDIVLLGDDASIVVRDSTYVTLDLGYPFKVAIAPKSGDMMEKPAGEWNSYDITINDGTLELWVNGEFMNKGTHLNLSSGKIALQAEGSAMEFRNIYIEEL